MQITMIAGGSRGDVQPYVALGNGLKQAGHTVRVLANQDYQDLITAMNWSSLTWAAGCRR